VTALPKQAPPKGKEPESHSYFVYVFRRFRRHKMAVFGLIVVTLLVLVAVFAPWVAPFDPNEIGVDFQAPPSATHWLGTDALGRDVLSRLIFGTRISLSVGVVSVSIYVVIGILLGAAAGYHGGWVDTAIMRLSDVFMSFPSLMLILVVVSLIGPSIFNVMMVLGLLGWPQIARIVRGQFLTLRGLDFVQAGRAMGARDVRLILRHLLPNAFSPVLVAATFGTAVAILSEAALSFLGLGVQPPTASWGNMLTDAQSLSILESMPWLWVPAGGLIFLAVLCINFVGDGLRDALDPRLKL
jgi:peptide/nickel transport system permease protein